MCIESLNLQSLTTVPSPLDYGFLFDSLFCMYPKPYLCTSSKLCRGIYSVCCTQNFVLLCFWRSSLLTTKMQCQMNSTFSYPGEVGRYRSLRFISGEHRHRQNKAEATQSRYWEAQLAMLIDFAEYLQLLQHVTCLKHSSQQPQTLPAPVQQTSEYLQQCLGTESLHRWQSPAKSLAKNDTNPFTKMEQNAFLESCFLNRAVLSFPLVPSNLPRTFLRQREQALKAAPRSLTQLPLAPAARKAHAMLQKLRWHEEPLQATNACLFPYASACTPGQAQAPSSMVKMKLPESANWESSNVLSWIRLALMGSVGETQRFKSTVLHGLGLAGDPVAGCYCWTDVPKEERDRAKKTQPGP